MYTYAYVQITNLITYIHLHYIPFSTFILLSTVSTLHYDYVRSVCYVTRILRMYVCMYIPTQALVLSSIFVLSSWLIYRILVTLL